jgi:hypothetical protein
LAPPVGAAVMQARSLTRPIWSVATRALRPGPEPASLLRPPRN